MPENKSLGAAFHLRTDDHHRIAGRHYRCGHDRAIVLVHGFFNNKDVYLFRNLAEDLSKYYDVIVFDLRGHGRSTGLFAWTARESKDLERVMAYVKECGYARIGVLSFSLGAAVAMAVAVRDKSIRSLIAVSTPTDFWSINFHFWEPEMLKDLRLNFGRKGIGKGVRPSHPFGKKIRPVDIIAAVSPTPVFLIHGANDWLIKPSHSEILFKKAKEPKKLLIIPKAGHAEKIYDSHPREFLDPCLEWFRQTLL